MRIIAGYLKGRKVQEPRGHKSHPMSEKMRGALFNTLGDIDGLCLLDAFAGSGALGIEAVSRGAARVVAIEKDSQAQTVIDHSISSLRIADRIKLIKANAAGWSRRNMEKKFDIIIMDPPYLEPQPNLLLKLVKRHLKAGGTAVLSYPIKASLPDFGQLHLAVVKSYGDAQLVFYQKKK